MDILQFLDSVASDSPTPGGGSASALAGALSASLVAMVAGLSSKKDKTMEKQMERIRKNGLSLQQRLYRAIAEDARSYDAVIQAFRLPKTTEKERLSRSKAIQKAYQKATVTPQLVCKLSLQLMEHSKFLILKGNPNAMSDTGVAAFLADAALAGGLLNIGINLVPVTDKVFLKKMRSSMKGWARERNRLMGEILRALIRIG